MTNRLKTAIVAITLTFSSCAPYSANTMSIRQSLSSGNYTGALDAVERAAHGPSKLLYFLESGLIAHYDGDYARSNILLERAERISDELFTRSLSRQLAAIVTSDESKHYRGETFELVSIHYYRALNYWYLDLREDALVECRKANLKLARYTSPKAATTTYKNDPFIHYVTALFYESEGEFNDAYVSLKDAESAYQTYAGEFGVPAPQALHSDLARVERELDYASTQLDVSALTEHLPTGSGELVVFAELGFIPRMTQEELSLPLYDSDLKRVRSGSVNKISRQIGTRHRRHSHSASVDYWLRVAVPRLEPQSSGAPQIRIIAGHQAIIPDRVQDLDAIARLNLEERSGSIFVRTITRALIKFAVTKSAEKKSEWLGFLVNAFFASTEKADTRSWVTLPREIQIGRLHLAPGQHTILIQSLGSSGRVIHEIAREVTIKPGERTFINHRQYT
jgi:hypothetical protein